MMYVVTQETLSFKSYAVQANVCNRCLRGFIHIVLCSWARHFTLTVPLSTQVYRWRLANLMLGGGVTLR